MILSFETKQLRAVCSSLLSAERDLGAADAMALLSILADMEAADNAAEFVELAGDGVTIVREGLDVDVGAAHSASFVVVGRRHVTVGGRPDLSTVRYLKLTGIVSC